MCRFKTTRPIPQLDLPLSACGLGGRRAGSILVGLGRGCRRVRDARRVSHRRRPQHDTRTPAYTSRCAPRAGCRRCATQCRSRCSETHSRPRRTRRSGSSNFPSKRTICIGNRGGRADGPLVAGSRDLRSALPRAVNRVLGRRGRVWGDRFHSHVLATPREVRNAFVYVLQQLPKALARRRAGSILLVGAMVLGHGRRWWPPGRDDRRSLSHVRGSRESAGGSTGASD